MIHLRNYFTMWGTPKELSTDDGTNLVSGKMVVFFKRWSVATCLSSAQYPQSNGRAEAKRILRNNVRSGGSLDIDKTSLALLQYLNTLFLGVIVSRPDEDWQAAEGRRPHSQ